MRVLVISGFLGAGKTTLIRELAQRTGRDFVVYENEYGQADVDAKELRAGSSLEVWESTENCICCSGKQDFASSVLTISNTLDPDYLVVEPTGVARLSNVTDNVRTVGYERIALLPSLCVVDARSWRSQRERNSEIFDDQVSSAATIVISKVGDAGLDEGNPEAAALLSLVRHLNPVARVESRPYARIPDDWWEGLLDGGDEAEARVADGTRRNHGHPTPEDDGLETISLAHAELASPAHLAWLLDAMSAGVFGRLARAKGSILCGGQWLRFDMVEREWAMTGCEPVDDPACVFIGSGLRRMWLREAFVPALWRDVAEIRHEHHHG